MSRIWYEREPKVCPGGDVGGDAQIGDAWEASWFCELADGTFAVVTRYFYPAQVEGGEPYMECQTEYLTCTDLNDPGGSEVWSDTTFEVGFGGDGWDAASVAEASQEPDYSEWAAVAPSWLGQVA